MCNHRATQEYFNGTEFMWAGESQLLLTRYVLSVDGQERKHLV